MFQHILERISPNFKFFTVNYISFGTMGVVSFFLVSGFVIPLSLEKTKSIRYYFIKRFFRLYPLYAFVLLLTLGFLFFSENQPTFQAVISNFTLFQEYFKQPSFIGDSWTLSLEIVWYVLFAVVFFVKLNRKPILLMTLSSLTVLLFTFVSLAIHKRLPLGRVGYIHTCFVGLLFYRYYTGEISRKAFISCLIMAIPSMVFAFAVTYGYFRHPVFSPACIFFTWGAGYLLFIIYFIRRSKGYNRVITYLGKISYSIYLDHSLILTACFSFLGLSFPAGTLVIVLTIILAHFTYLYVESPGIRFGKRSGKRFQMTQTV